MGVGKDLWTEKQTQANKRDAARAVSVLAEDAVLGDSPLSLI
jgi:hypothetical protein